MASAWILLEAGSPGGSSNFFMLMIILCMIWYFLLIRPQQKHKAARTKQVEALNKNDAVLTLSGIFGTVTRIQGQQIVLRICDKTGAQMTVTKSAIAGKVEPETETEEEKDSTS